MPRAGTLAGGERATGAFVGALVGALVVGALVGALVVGALVGALVVGALVGALVVGALDGFLAVGALVGALVTVGLHSARNVVKSSIFTAPVTRIQWHKCRPKNAFSKIKHRHQRKVSHTLSRVSGVTKTEFLPF